MTIHSERHGLVHVITIDRPARRNALDHEALEGLTFALAAAADARVTVLTGADGHFCAGADLTAVEDASFATLLQGVLEGFCNLPMPVLGAISGAALGAGTQLASVCDLRVATPDASFGIPAVKLGLMVNHWTVRRVTALAGESTARAMLIAGEVVSGARAHDLGFVHRLGGFDDAMGWASDLTKLAPLTMAGHKLSLDRVESATDPLVEAAFHRAWSSDDLVEGKAAFAERRPPEFRGR